MWDGAGWLGVGWPPAATSWRCPRPARRDLPPTHFPTPPRHSPPPPHPPPLSPPPPTCSAAEAELAAEAGKAAAGKTSSEEGEAPERTASGKPLSRTASGKVVGVLKRTASQVSAACEGLLLGRGLPWNQPRLARKRPPDGRTRSPAAPLTAWLCRCPWPPTQSRTPRPARPSPATASSSG